MRKRIINEMRLTLPARGENESLCRAVITAFAAELDPGVEELSDLRCAVSEAVTNSIVHGYKELDPAEVGYVYISARLYEGGEITVEISDNGCGIADVELARRPMYTTGDPGERCGMGFLVMESFTDHLSVKSRLGRGTTVLMRKKFKP